MSHLARALALLNEYIGVARSPPAFCVSDGQKMTSKLPYSPRRIVLNKNTVSIMVMRNGKPSTFSAVYSASVTSPRYTHLTSNVCAYNVDHRTHAGRSGAGAGVQWVKGK